MPVSFGHVSDLTLIGGSDLMVFAAEQIRATPIGLRVVLAPRHATQILPIRNITICDALNDLNVSHKVVDDINAPESLDEGIPGGPESMALCFGPAWVFNDRVVDHFGAGMINFHPIPIPRYLGGAHYTWQILNGDRSVGMVIQEIGSEVDRGNILRIEEAVLPSNARVPGDYFLGNYSFGCKFISRFFDDMQSDHKFSKTAFSLIDRRRIFFPRLNTIENAIIDWSWTAEEIERFCCAFDDPYPGAATFLNGTRHHLRNVGSERGDGYTHPFCNGLIVRKTSQTVWVAAPGGLLVIRSVLTGDDENCIESLKEGQRFWSPKDHLDPSRQYKAIVTGIA